MSYDFYMNNKNFPPSFFQANGLTFGSILTPWRYKALWGSSWSIVALWVLGAVMILSGAIAGGLGGSEQDYVSLIGYGVLFGAVSVGRVAALILGIDTLSVRDDSRFTWLTGRKTHLWWGVAVGVVFAGLMLVVSYLVPALFPGVDFSNTQTVQFSGYSPVVLGLMLIVFAPLFEEVIWRGLVLKSCVMAGAVPWVAVLVQGLFFAAVHFWGIPLTPGIIVSGIFLAVFGICLGALRVKSGSLLPGLLAHAIYNASVLAILLLV